MNFAGICFVISLFLYLGFVLAEPVILQLREQYAGRAGALAWHTIRFTACIIAGIALIEYIGSKL